MNIKDYRNNKGVIFENQTKNTAPSKKIKSSATFLIIINFFVFLNLYYLNFSYSPKHQNNTLSPAAVATEAFHKQLLKKIGSPLLSVVQKTENKLTIVNKQNISHVSFPYKMEEGTDTIIWHGPRDEKQVALTFDADMTPVMVDYLRSGQVQTYDDSRITDYLIQNGIKATFFLTGIWIQTYPKATKALAENPLFELENHTYSHPSMFGYCFDQPEIPKSQYPYEIEKAQALLKQVAGVTARYFRFPGGCYDKADLELVRKEGLTTVHWDDVANDGFNTNERQIIHNVLSEARNGSIIVMHMGGQPNAPETAAALPAIIAGLKQKGFHFVTVSELLNPQKPHTPQTAKVINLQRYLLSWE